ncbi:GDP-mannose 4,6-dehydratase, partial [Methylicorpusculum sp.]|uniref:GDP-mannose 4,6-dehydratase n=1 Tax=Methylicorpusculum sp. TaxID=2713644 RepID=UPI002ABB1AAB
MKILVTGTAGFIGNRLAQKLLERCDEVIGVDNLNDYYDVNLKLSRLKLIGDHAGYTDIRADLADRTAMEGIFKQHQPQRVVNLAA